MENTQCVDRGDIRRTIHRLVRMLFPASLFLVGVILVSLAFGMTDAPLWVSITYPLIALSNFAVACL